MILFAFLSQHLFVFSSLFFSFVSSKKKRKKNLRLVPQKAWMMLRHKPGVLVS